MCSKPVLLNPYIMAHPKIIVFVKHIKPIGVNRGSSFSPEKKWPRSFNCTISGLGFIALDCCTIILLGRSAVRYRGTLVMVGLKTIDKVTSLKWSKIPEESW